MENDYIKSLPHGKDIDAVSGFIYIGEAGHILSLWKELMQSEAIHSGTNFDLSSEIENIDYSRKLYIMYDFLHRVMLFYYNPEKETETIQMDLVSFKNYIGV